MGFGWNLLSLVSWRLEVAGAEGHVGMGPLFPWKELCLLLLYCLRNLQRLQH